MSAFKTVARNVLSNWAGFLVNAVVAFQLTPFVEQKLGSSQWGFWSLLIACTGYYGLLDLGIRSAVAQYVTRYFAKRDLDGVRRTVNTALGILLTIAAGLVVLTLPFAWLAPHIFEIEGVDHDTTRLLFVIVGCGVALNLPLTIFQTATYARQRFDLANGIGIVQRLGSAALTWWALDSGHGLVAVSLIHLGGNLVGSWIHFGLSFRMLPGLRLTARDYSRDSVRELFGFSVWNVLINAADQVQTHASALVISIVISTKAFAHFNMGLILMPYALQLVNSIAWTLTPRATSLDAKGDRDGLRTLYLDGTRAIVAFAAVLSGGMILLGDDLLRLWVDPRYTAGTEYVSSSIILAVLTGGMMLRSTVACAKQICFGLREVRSLARMTFAEAVLNIALTIGMVYWLGILGAAIASVLAIVLTQVWMLPAFLGRRIEVPWTRLGRSVVAGGVVLAVMPLLHVSLFAGSVASSWGEFLLRAAALGLPGLFVAIAIGTTADEKARLFARLRQKSA
ncbi:MAG: lipopolysaccharide biosynthesis protein [Planctomycetota bacterium]